MQKIKNIESRNFLIYTLSDPRNMEIRYVGVTCTTLSARLSQHIYDSKKGGTYKRNWILSLIKLNMKPIISVIEVTTHLRWEEREKYWISYYENLTNSNSGGTGVVLNRTKESIRKSSEAKMKKIVAINSAKQVFHFNSQKEASILLNVPRTSIEYSTSSLNNCSYGYNFLLLEDYREGIENSLPVSLKKKSYTIIYEQESYTPLEFSKFLGVSETTVYLWCSGKVNWRKSQKLKNKIIEIIMI